MAPAVLDRVLHGDGPACAARRANRTSPLVTHPAVLRGYTRHRLRHAAYPAVVRDDGGPIGFRQALVRGLAGLLLEKPGLAGPLTMIAGVATASVSAGEKRLGDMMAGTVVLNERAAPLPFGQPPQWVPPPLQQWVLALDMHRLDDRLALSLRQFVTRAYSMSDNGRYALGEQLRERVLAVTSPPPPQYAPTPDVLISVLVERRRRAATTQVGRPPFPHAPPHPAQPNGPPPGVGGGPFVVPF